MVEKKEFAVVFECKLNDDNTKSFIPVKVIEGKYDSEYNWFVDSEDKVPYIHIEDAPENVLGFANRIVVSFEKYSISSDRIETIKQEILANAKEYTYLTNEVNGCIIATNNVTGDEYLIDDYDDIAAEETTEEIKKDIELNLTPLEIESKVKETIKGQDEAVRKIVTALWTTLKFRNMRKKNMLIVGPSGVGKTAIFEKIKKILNIPVIIFSVPGLSQAGYVGRSTDEILKQVYYESVEDLDLAEKTIVILDEIDKIASHSGGDVSTSGVQNELLKIIEGCTRYIESSFPGEPGFEMDTSKMIFIATGAFQELHEVKKNTIGFNQTSSTTPTKTTIDTEKLINYGLKRELVGRLPIIVELKNLGKEELKDIVVNSDESELIATSNALKELGVEIENLDETIDYIVEDAVKNKLGARGLILTINNLFQEIFYEVGNNPGKYSKVILGPNIIKDKYDFQLIKKRTYTKKRVKTING